MSIQIISPTLNTKKTSLLTGFLGLKITKVSENYLGSAYICSILSW